MKTLSIVDMLNKLAEARCKRAEHERLAAEERAREADAARQPQQAATATQPKPKGPNFTSIRFG